VTLGVKALQDNCSRYNGHGSILAGQVYSEFAGCLAGRALQGISQTLWKEHVTLRLDCVFVSLEECARHVAHVALVKIALECLLLQFRF